MPAKKLLEKCGSKLEEIKKIDFKNQHIHQISVLYQSTGIINTVVCDSIV